MAAAFAWFGGVVVAILVAIVLTTALRRIIPGLEAALGLSMLLMGSALHVSGLLSGTGPWPVVILVAVSHAIAGTAMWQRQKLRGS
nr:hypothetical protein [uncultured Roseococcus sp.]